MAKAPTRLSDFAIPREPLLPSYAAPEKVGTTQPLVSAHEEPLETQNQINRVTDQADRPTFPRPASLPTEEPRRQIGARIRLSVAERLRTCLYVSRESQQDAVEAALDAYLSAKGF